MTRNLHREDLPQLADLWAKFYPSRYHVSADLISFNAFDSGLLDWGASAVCESIDGNLLGFVLIKKSGAAYYKGPDPDTAHLSALAFSEPGIGVEMMEHVKRTLRNRGFASLVFGMDWRHFFPGAPTDFPALHNFLTIEGFQAGGEAVDLERDMETYVNPFPPKFEDLAFRPVGVADVPALKDFFEREFPGRWCFDVMKKIEAEGGPSMVFGMFGPDRCEGFALLQNSSCASTIAGAVWHLDLGENWGSLGPIGISKDRRGNGEGNALLGAALEHLRDLGTRRAIIDWTTLVKFYRGHGFEVARTYRSMTLRLEE